MDWKSVVSKNCDKIIEPIIKLEEKIDYEKQKNEYIPYMDVDNEFDFEYSRIIASLKEEFKEYINYHALPFMDEDHINFNFNFKDFIKNNSSNYLKIEKKVEEFNNEIDKIIAEENKHLDEEYEEYQEIYN
jgi:hypothetical protein